MDWMKPGIKSKTMIIKIDTSWFQRGYILETTGESVWRITKIYKYNWYRKVLNFFGIRFKMFDCIEVKINKDG